MADERIIREAEIAAARAVKVDRLVEVFERVGTTAEAVEGLTDENWSLAAEVAGVRTPSLVTRGAVLAVLRERERRAAERTKAEEATCVECGAELKIAVLTKHGRRDPVSEARLCGRCAVLAEV